MDEILHLTLLYDFYGELLTEKQKQVFDLHYQDDLSLSEMLDILQEMETDGLSEKRIRQLEKMKQIAEAILS